MTRETPKEPAKERKDYEVVKPPQDLRSKVKILEGKDAARFDPVQAAEAALQRLSGEFDAWMGLEVGTLLDAWAALPEGPLTEEGKTTLFRAAHDIKGQAGTLGYPLAGAVAGNLCYLFEHVSPAADIPRVLVEQHIDAVRAMVAEGAKDADNEVAKALVTRLADVTDDFISRR
ncbi:Hpt domain-containing protein [Stappia sp. F7233]|uniref:Hpt domain-containing protein n=1 Tax=Stappia albiluteola TaxID=2758565 RepID=A0A839AGB5_9HYPH|nr:Hpt domain-containing protein [Stappia albiluteola]MBA5777589.1 Hpt domain-containing protein [Stappia albiluteola]